VSTLVFLGMAALVTASMMMLDVAHARYSLTMVDVRRGLPVRHRAARWSVLGWAAGAVCFYLTVRYSMALLPFEALGLYIGTIIGTAGASSGVAGDEVD
jgi:hypothetical protein